MTPAEYQHQIESCGGAAEPLGEGARRYWLEKWRRFYAARLHAATRRWKLDGFEWHVFSFAHAPALNGEPALEAYLAEHPAEFVVCPESDRFPAYRLRGATLPDLRPLGADVYVAPPDLAWTLAFTHEESLGLGPYFCRREWLEAEGASPVR